MRAGAWATLWTLLLIAAIVVGSRNLQNFDAALVIYTFAVIFATWGVVYHYAVWLDKPPTRMFTGTARIGQSVRGTGRAFEIVRQSGAAGTHIFAQTFIASGRGCVGGCTR